MTDGVEQRALAALKTKRDAERAKRNAAAQKEAVERANRIKRDSAEFVKILQNGEFADPYWVVEDVVYVNGDMTAGMKGVIFTHPTFYVPNIFVDLEGMVYEATQASPSSRPFGWRGKWVWNQPLSLEYFGTIIERKKEEYERMMSRD